MSKVRWRPGVERACFAQEVEVARPLPSLRQLHEEMQATMYQLHAIRSELQGGINLFQPG